MSLYDKILEAEDLTTLTNLLINLDSWLESLHQHGFCIYDFNIKKIILENGKLTFNSFKEVINDIGISDNAAFINILQSCKIGLMAYNHMTPDGNMNQEYFDYLKENLNYFNQNGQIPSDIYEYYEKVFESLDVCYMNDYLITKQREENSSQNTNIRRKTLSTEVGRMYAKEEAAYVSILFIPSILTLIYLIGLIVYTFVLK